MAGSQRRKEKQSSGVRRKNHTHITIEESKPLKSESAYAHATQVVFLFSSFKKKEEDDGRWTDGRWEGGQLIQFR